MFGDARIEFFKGVALRAVVDVAAGILGVADEAGEFAVEVTAASRDGVDGNVVAKKFGEGVVVRVIVEFCAILPIADEKDDFATATFFRRL